MKLNDLGFDPWFEAHASDLNEAGQDIARISAVDRGSYLIRNEHREVAAELSGRLSYLTDSPSELPCVGDWVAVQYFNSDEEAIIHGVLPRKTFLRRKTAGDSVDYQMIASNIDVAFIVQSCHIDFNPKRVDRYLVMAADGKVDPVIILTKTDLISEDELDQKLEITRVSAPAAGVLALSNMSGVGFDRFQQMLVPGKTYCLLGSSGVGKTTIINRLIGQDTFHTKAVGVTGKGTHTTTRRQLILLSQGSMLIDTPGMREVGLLGAGDGISRGFDEIQALSSRCRYGDCSHEREKGCAVLSAVESGELSEERYASYLKLRKESEYHEMSYLDRRKKDREFGRFIKTFKKQIKK